VDPDVVHTFTLPDRTDDDVFADTDTTTDIVPRPELGDTVNHDESDDDAHDVFDDTVTLRESAVANAVHVDCDNDKLGVTKPA